MIRPLLKKQLLEVFAWVFVDRKSGKSRSGKNLLIYVALYIFLFGYLGVMFYMMADFLCEPLVTAGLGWFYFTLMSFMGIIFGVVGSVFNTYSSLYNAKDNDLLFSLPIHKSSILLSRLIGVYAVGLLYELLVMVPAVAVWYIHTSPNFLGCVFSALIPIVLSFFVLTLSCILGYAVALISSKLKSKNFVIVALSLLFIVAYYYLYSKAYELLQELITNPKLINDGVKNALYPFYQMGLAAGGKILPMIIFTAIVAALFAVVYWILSSKFIKIATTKKGERKIQYQGNREKSGSMQSALLKKELRRLLGSPTYMLNCGLGSIMLLVVAVFLIVKSDTVNTMFAVFGVESKETIWLIVAAAVAMLTSMCDFTAPSVSLEGKHIWIVKTLPISSKEVLYAKLKLHLSLTLIPAVICATAAAVVSKMTVTFAALTILATVSFSVFSALFGLFANLKFPNLEWTNEVVPIKQSMSVFLSLFGGWALTLGLGVLYYFIREFLIPVVFLLLCIAVLSGLSSVLFVWLKTKGVKIFENL